MATKPKTSRPARTKLKFRLEVQAPSNGKLGKATVVAIDEHTQQVCHSDKADLASAPERAKVVKRMAEALGVRGARQVAKLQKDFEANWHGLMDQRRQQLELAAAGSPEAAPSPAAPESPDKWYTIKGGYICRRKPMEAAEILIPLCNFAARIVDEVVHDDGAETSIHFSIEGELYDGTPLSRTEVPTASFANLGWALSAWGTQAVVYAGQGNQDHLRAAIQLLSPGVPRHVVYGHTGWREVGGVPVYLHGGGAVGTVGTVSGVNIALPGPLASMVLPDPPAGEELAKAVRASLRVLDLGPARITVAALGTAYRAVLGHSDASTHFAGPTGSFKTELLALMQQHYGAGFNSRNLPGNFSSTGNATEGLAFVAKDMLLGIDDFAPSGPSADVARLHQSVDRLYRNAGNHTSRQRMRRDGSLQPPKPPRGTFGSTGEEIPRGHSVRARLNIVEMARGDLDVQKLTDCQADAAAGLYAASMSGFVRWLAGRYHAIQKEMPGRLAEIRDGQQGASQHRRTPANLAQLVLGFDYFLRFAEESGAITGPEKSALEDRVQKAVLEIGKAQETYHQDADQVMAFLRLLRACITSGRAHVAATKGDEPQKSPEAWGWRSRTAGAGEHAREVWEFQGRRVGWLDGEHLYLDPESAHAEAQRLAAEKGDSLGLSAQTLGKRLAEKGMLLSREKSRERLTVRRTLENRRQDVWHLDARGFFCGEKTVPTIPTVPETTQPVASGTVMRDGLWDGNGPPGENRPA
jgi:hypothetical protein